MIRVLKKFAAIASASLALVALSVMPLASAATSTVLISGDTAAAENSPGWMFNRDTSTDTPYEFNTDKASIGVGSLYVKPIGATPADKFIAEDFLLKPIAQVNSVAYDFLIAGNGTAASAGQFYMNVYANFGSSPATKFYDCRYNVVPTVGSTTNFTTVTFNPASAYPVTTSGTSPFPCPASPAGMNALSANSTIRAVALNVGDSTASDMGLAGYLDKVVVATTGDTTTYNFDPLTTPTTKDQCRNNGWKNFNTPTFKNEGQCIRYVQQHSHKVRGSVRYTAFGLERRAVLHLNSGDNNGGFTYSDANGDWYDVDVTSVKVSGNTAWFAGEVTSASNPAWVGQWLSSKVEDNSPDKVWGDFSSQAAAEAGVSAMTSPASGPFNVTRGNIRVN